MMMGAALTTVMLVRSKTVSRPQEAAVVIWPVQGSGSGSGTGVPARYMVVPFSTATVATGTATGAQTPKGGQVVFVRSSFCTLAWLPPHSAPQFTTKAVLSSPLKKAVTGRSKPPTKVTVGLPVPNEMTATESELSLNARRRLPLWPSAKKRTAGTSSSAVIAPVFIFRTSIAPGDWATTDAVGTAM